MSLYIKHSVEEFSFASVWLLLDQDGIHQTFLLVSGSHIV